MKKLRNENIIFRDGMSSFSLFLCIIWIKHWWWFSQDHFNIISISMIIFSKKLHIYSFLQVQNRKWRYLFTMNWLISAFVDNNSSLCYFSSVFMLENDQVHEQIVIMILFTSIE
jgi:hypothetical protein